MTATLDHQVADLQRRLDEALAERDEAQAQKAALAEVLEVINDSPGDLDPVFNAILKKAHDLCGAETGVLLSYDGECYWPLAAHGTSARFLERARQGFRPGINNPFARVLRGERFVQIPDVAEFIEGVDDPELRIAVDMGIRTFVVVPLRKDDKILGAISANRRTVRPLTEKQIALLQSFATQAVIAIENARLITETRETLEKQTATAEILRVISKSPTDLQPTFDVIAARATTLCGAVSGAVFRFDGSLIHFAANYGWDQEELQATQSAFPMPPGQGSITARAIMDRKVAYSADVSGDLSVQPILAQAFRTVLSVPMLRDGNALGAITVTRRQVEPFTDAQIELLQTFADQAVIAIENVRLFTELGDALEQQTATAEVLGVINSFPGDLSPVFEAILEKAHSTCGVTQGSLQIFDGDKFRAVAVRGLPKPFADRLRECSWDANAPVTKPLFAGERFVHVPDLAQIDHPMAQAAVQHGDTRTFLCVPLRKGDALFGMIVAARREVRPFSGKEIGLLENFAAQAVIAMDNARLITETREALEQQTATAEVLGVINSSPGNLAPVFDEMLEKATRLCEAVFGVLVTVNDELIEFVAQRNVPERLVEFITDQPMRLDPATILGRSIVERRVVHTLDNADSDAYRQRSPLAVAAVEFGGVRTILHVPLIKDDRVLGVFIVFRQEVRPFSEKQIALLENFAAQAVIAIENARLINETREALEQQTATADVLQVINSSPGDLAPIFDAMLEKAMQLCEAETAHLLRYEGGAFSRTASRGVSADFDKILPLNVPVPNVINRDSVPYRTLASRSAVNLADLREDESYRAGAPAETAAVEKHGVRSILFVPLLKESEVVGCFVMHRLEVRPFSDKHIALLQSFAAQAVIAMDNARLLDEIRQRQAELRVTFENMADGVVMFDENLRLAAWNRNFQEMLDLPDALLTERPSYADYVRILAERGEFGTENIEAELNRRLEHTDQEFRTERTRPDGRVIEVRRNAVPDGGFVLIYSDITERKRSEAEIHAARDAAEAAYRDLKAAQSSLIQAQKMAALGQLTAGIAHEIKNPLNFVNNFAGLSVELLDELKETAAPAIQALDEDKRAEIDETIEMLTGNLEKIAEHGRRADGIVKSMLEHSRGVTSERRKVDLNNLVEEALNLAYHGARAQDQDFNITLEREYDRDLPEVELVPQEVNRVFINLIGNGFYAATKRQRDSGGPDFRPTLTVATRDLGEAVEIRIRDNGIGIPAEIKDKLFQPFFTTKPTGEGTGLGLSISYDIVTQQHGGTIEVDSRVGEFTEFTVRLPRAYRATAEAAS
jgi:PAS domain S-box-containing protein